MEVKTPDESPTEMQMLPASTVRLIASSQVITSVVSVVKELTENSLDALATNVDIKLENYGFDKIEIRDNGRGIKQSDTTYMAQRHYTSKISDQTDLDKLQTYGFRGEALASMCAVGMVTIVTKTAEDNIGMMYTLDQQGKVTAVKPASVNQGTSVYVCQLFKHTPVRKQYYNNTKRRKDELKKVEDLVMAFGVINPKVRFTLRHDKTTIIQKNKVNDYRAALMNVLGTSVMSQMETLSHTNQESQVTIDGFMPKVGSNAQVTSRVSNDRCFVFVNKRPVHLKEIEKVVKQYYTSSTKCDFSHPRYPVMFLSIQVPADVVDVNLDPNKTTVMLHNKDAILETLSSMLEKLYSTAELSGKQTTKEQKNELHTDATDCSEIQTSREHLDKCNTDTGFTQGVQEEFVNRNIDNRNGKFVVKEIIEVNTDLGSHVRHEGYTNLGSPVRYEGNTDLGSPVRNAVNTILGSPVRDLVNTGLGGPETNNGIDSVDFSMLNHESIDLLHAELEEFNDSVTMENVEKPVIENNSEFQSHGSLHSANSHGTGSHTEKYQRNLNETMTATDNHKDHIQNSADNGHRFSDHLIGASERTSSTSANQDTDLMNTANQIGGSGEGTSSNNVLLKRIYSEQKDLCRVQDHQKPDSEIGVVSWSKGQAVVNSNGKTVQPVQLLSGPALRKNTESASMFNTPKSSPGRKNKHLEMKVGQTTLYDMVGSTPVKRPTPAIQFFSQHIKPQVLEDHPGVDALTVNKIITEKWDEMATEERENFETMAKKDTDRYLDKVKSAKRPRTPVSALQRQGVPSSKRKKVELSPNQTLIESMMSPKQRKAANENTETKVPIKVIDVTFDMEILRRKEVTQPKDEDKNSLSLIGRVKPHGIWLAQRNKDIVVFNPYRVEESLLYHRLLGQHMLPRQPLDVPVVLNQSIVGGRINWQTLLSMQSTVNLPDPTRVYTEHRLIANGFEIHQTTDFETQDVSLKIVSMATCLPYYGLGDLKELLELVATTTANTVAKCRPIKVIHYLQGEAVRMAHNLSTNLSRTDIEDMILRKEEQLPIGCRQCFHDRPFDIPIHSLGN